MLKLTTWERFVIVNNIIGPMQVGDVKTMRKAGKILDAVELKEDEKKQINFQIVGQRPAWDNDEELESQVWDIELDPDSLALLKEKVKNPPMPFHALQYKWVLHLYDTLGITDD